MARKRSLASQSRLVGQEGSLRKSSKISTLIANDIALLKLLSDAVAQDQELLLRVETECAKVGLGLKGPKTKNLTYNIDAHPPLVYHTPLVTRNDITLEEKGEF